MSLKSRHRLSTVAVLSVFTLVACGGSDGSDPAAPSSGQPPAPSGLAKTLAVAVSEATGTNCPYGGVKVNAGVDANGNGVLDSSEVSSVQYVCNGAPGVVGAPGAKGLSSLVQTSTEPAGGNCPNGGTKVAAGIDTNSDGALAASEVTSTGYVCNGSSGTNGTNGTNGSNGTNGADGLSTRSRSLSSQAVLTVPMAAPSSLRESTRIGTVYLMPLRSVRRPTTATRHPPRG